MAALANQRLGATAVNPAVSDTSRRFARHAPAIAWFHGTSAYRLFLVHASMPRKDVAVGLQPERVGATRIFVTPNPSGANPSANPKQLVPLYRELAALRDRLRPD